jgi:hypothetical protein
VLAASVLAVSVLAADGSVAVPEPLEPLMLAGAADSPEGALGAATAVAEDALAVAAEAELDDVEAGAAGTMISFE